MTATQLVRRLRAVVGFVATCAAPGCGNTVSAGQVMCSACASK